MNPRLSPEELRRRLDERNARTSARRKAERALTKKVPYTPQERKEAARLSAKRQRERARQSNGSKREQNAAYKLTPEYAIEKEAKRLAKNAKDRANYLAKKGSPLTYGKQNKLKPLPKKMKAKLKPMTVATPKAIGRIMPNRNIDLNALVKLQLDHKTTIFIRPDQDPETIRTRFLNRRG